MTPRAGLVCLLLASSALGCRGGCRNPAGIDERETEAASLEHEPLGLTDAEAEPGAPPLPPRCQEGTASPLAVKMVGASVSQGEALWVSAIKGQELVVVRLPGGETTVLRAAAGDAPPPALSEGEGQPLAAYFGEPSKNVQHAVVVALSAPQTPLLRVERATDESLALDVASWQGAPHVVWNDGPELWVQSAAAKTALRVGPAALHGALKPKSAGEPREAAVQLESPRLLRVGQALVVLAVARAWDANERGFGHQKPSSWEGAGERRSSAYLVGFVLRGAPASPRVEGPFVLSPREGQLEAFEPRLRGESVQLLLRDGARAAQDRGGSLSLASWSLHGAAEARVLLEEGVGSAPLSLLEQAAGYGDALGESMLRPLAGGRASREPLLDEARIVGGLADGSLVRASVDQLRTIRCDGVKP